MEETKNYEVEVLTENKAEVIRLQLRQDPEVQNLVTINRYTKSDRTIGIWERTCR